MKLKSRMTCQSLYTNLFLESKSCSELKSFSHSPGTIARIQDGRAFPIMFTYTLSEKYPAVLSIHYHEMPLSLNLLCASKSKGKHLLLDMGDDAMTSCILYDSLIPTGKS